jgi:hypothetical protein
MFTFEVTFAMNSGISPLKVDAEDVGVHEGFLDFWEYAPAKPGEEPEQRTVALIPQGPVQTVIRVAKS